MSSRVGPEGFRQTGSTKHCVPSAVQGLRNMNDEWSEQVANDGQCRAAVVPCWKLHGRCCNQHLVFSPCVHTTNVPKRADCSSLFSRTTSSDLNERLG